MAARVAAKMGYTNVKVFHAGIPAWASAGNVQLANTGFVKKRMGFLVMIDTRGPQAAEKGHIQGAISLPHARINEASLGAYPPETLFVVYCAGPHCNATEKAAIRLAKLGRPVKKMIGGITGWLDEGFSLTEG